MEKEVNKSELVNKILRHCLFKDLETAGKTQKELLKIGKLGDGIVTKYCFHPKRIEEKKEDIRWLLDEMPKEFHANSGGGMSFLNLCMDKHGTHWAEHKTMGDLIAIGMAAGYANFCLPREMWDALPGGMPYVAFNTGS